MLTLLISTHAYCEIFVQDLSKGKTLKIDIQLLNGLHVNKECVDHKKECLKYILELSNKSTSLSKKEHSLVLGNPASTFCNNNKGKSEILRDSKNNEYDYCVLKEKYIIDSWDLYHHSQKK